MSANGGGANETPPTSFRAERRIGSDGRFYPAEHTEQEEDSFYLSMATKTSKAAYATATGKVFRLRTLIINNPGKKKTITLSNGSGLSFSKLRIAVASAAGPTTMTGIKGIVFTSTVYVQATSFSAGLSVVMAGELGPNEPGM